MMQSIVSLTALVVLIVVIKARKKDIFEPFNLFALTILLSFFLSSLGLSTMQNNYGFLPIIFLVVVLSSFFVGDLIGKSNLFRKTSARYTVNKAKLRKIIYVLFWVVFLAFVGTWAVCGAPPLFSKADRATYYADGIGLFYMLIDSLSFLIIYDSLYVKALKRKSVIKLMLAVLFMIVATANKFQVFYLLAQLLIIYNLKRKKIRLKFSYLLVGLAAVIGIFAIFYNFIYSGMYVSSQEIYKAAGMNLPTSLAFLTEPYLYVAYNFENLFHFMSIASTKVLGGGYFLTRKLLGSVGLTAFFFPEHAATEQVWTTSLQHSWLTTGTLFKEFFLDFRWPGVFIGALITGFACGRVYKRIMMDKDNLLNVYLYTSCSVSLMLSFMTNNFVTTRLVINILCMVVIYLLCRRKNVHGE